MKALILGLLLALAPRVSPAQEFLWIPALDGTFAGSMTTIADGTALLGEAIHAPSSNNSTASPDNPDFVTYPITLPVSGAYYMWGRLYYFGNQGSNSPNSFWVTLRNTSYRLGNKRDAFSAWHWDGDGRTEYGPWTPIPLGIIPAGDYTLRVSRREGGSTPPRLDTILITDESGYIPNDTEALAGLLGGGGTPTTVPATTLPSPPPPTTTLPATDADNDALWGDEDPCPDDPRNLCYGESWLRINAGGGSVVDCSGTSWNADTGSAGSLGTYSCTSCAINNVIGIFGCSDPATQNIFQTERYGAMVYSFPTTNGPHVVNLHFANIYGGTSQPGTRVFDVYVEGQAALLNFDQVAESGGTQTAIVRAVTTDVADGTLNIEFRTVTEEPAVKAIEVRRGVGGPTLPPPTTTVPPPTTTTTTTTTTTLPAAPKYPVLIRWDWSDTTGVSHFNLYCSDQNSQVPDTLIAQMPPAESNAYVALLEEGVYSCAVTAVSGTQESELSNVIANIAVPGHAVCGDVDGDGLAATINDVYHLMRKAMGEDVLLICSGDPFHWTIP